jgi:hypothetical protein
MQVKSVRLVGKADKQVYGLKTCQKLLIRMTEYTWCNLIIDDPNAQSLKQKGHMAD